MNIAQIEQDKYQIFNSITDERKRNASINAVKYIKTLASMSNTNIQHWKVIDLFKSENGLVTDRTAINKIFFSYRDNAPVNPTTIDEVNYKKLMDLQKNRSQVNNGDLLTKCRRKTDEAQRYYTDYYLKYIKEANLLYRRYQQAQLYTPNYAVEIENLCKAGFYELRNIGTEIIELDTANDVIITHVNRTHGIKRSVNMGKFTISFNVMTSVVRCYVLGNNIVLSSYPHPHVSGHAICFGELSNEAQDLIASGNLTAVMELAQKILTSYNDDSAYRPLQDYENKRIEMERIANEQEKQAKKTKEEIQLEQEARDARDSF